MNEVYGKLKQDANRLLCKVNLTPGGNALVGKDCISEKELLNVIESLNVVEKNVIGAQIKNGCDERSKEEFVSYSFCVSDSSGAYTLIVKVPENRYILAKRGANDDLVKKLDEKVGKVKVKIDYKNKVIRKVLKVTAGIVLVAGFTGFISYHNSNLEGPSEFVPPPEMIHLYESNGQINSQTADEWRKKSIEIYSQTGDSVKNSDDDNVKRSLY